MTPFSIECFQNEFLPRGGDQMSAVLTISASGTSSGPATAEERSELILVDCSGSMSGKKLRSAKTATAAAIDCIPDGVRFGIISGNHEAELTYPPEAPLAVASPETREAAKAAAKKLEPAGGTAMGAWIRLAAEVFGDAPGIRHAILLTDGKNESEISSDLDAALQLAEGKFQCDCRGVGEKWVVAELRKVASALVGSYDIVADPADLEDDFSTMMRDALSKQVAEVTFRVWTPQGGEVLALKQMEPPLDLTAGRVEAGPRMGDYGTGSWGDESRDYLLTVGVPPADVGEEKLAARVTLLVGDEPGEQGMIRAVWTDDVARSTQINKQVAAAMDEEELAEEIQGVVDSFRIGDVDSATNRAAKAVRMAHEAGNLDVIDRLSKLVDIEDAATGRVRPKGKVDALELMIFETRSTRTSRTPKSTPSHPFAGSDPTRCGICGRAPAAEVHAAASAS
jgi:hypothetical protein